jgi:uncharacterized protein involved in exopolysaccharide biosynthesis
MNNLDKNIADQEQDIDLIELTKKFWKNRKFIIKICGTGAVIGLIIAFSIPREYRTTVVLVPEVNTNNNIGFGALAAMAGINLQQNVSQEISPELYPDILNSTPFLVGLFNVNVKDIEKNIDTTLFAFLENRKKPWWNYIIGGPVKFFNSVFSDKENVDNIDGILTNSNIMELTKKQEDILDELHSRIHVHVNKKTGAISLSAMMQSAAISAYIADTITSYTQEYIIDYRTQKARFDLDFAERLYNESKLNYYNAQQAYAAYIDENLAIVSSRFKTTQERLQNEMNLTYSVYNQMAQQLQLAKVKVQDITPVYTIIQPAVVPLHTSKPPKKLILAGFLFLSFAIACGWIYAKEVKNEK